MILEQNKPPLTNFTETFKSINKSKHSRLSKSQIFRMFRMHIRKQISLANINFLLKLLIEQVVCRRREKKVLETKTLLSERKIRNISLET